MNTVFLVWVVACLMAAKAGGMEKEAALGGRGEKGMVRGEL